LQQRMLEQEMTPLRQWPRERALDGPSRDRVDRPGAASVVTEVASTRRKTELLEREQK
jgi:hypothetical protein